uniref:Ig-like domain-containing protein n=1 Tax=Xiphophorus couchianus TaxID=32473 RepID=A0A3B5LJE2_9TELE
SVTSDLSDVYINEKVVLKSVSFKCEPNLPAEWKIIWYKNYQPLDKEGPSFNIESVTANDKGAYACQAKLKSRPFSTGFSNTTNLNVKCEFSSFIYYCIIFTLIQNKMTMAVDRVLYSSIVMGS